MTACMCDGDGVLPKDLRETEKRASATAARSAGA